MRQEKNSYNLPIEGFEKLLTQVRAIQVAQGLPKVVFGLEPTANYHKPLGEHLIGWWC